ncbi:MAG: SpoIIE family protein phosphatase, partial [Leptospiraceae bacterium]|nr:SpoIIE family protein phosphatase [Leptospiraceae bacterium]
SLTLRKIGMTGLDGSLNVKTYQLHRGDILILGSDGRDDILLNYSESGQRVINEDETLFLRHVEKGKGDLEKITQVIQETGELTDDYTLLKITYLGEEEATDVYSQEKFYELVTKANHAYENKDYKTALSLYEEAYQIHSRDKNVLQKLIHLYFGSKDYEKTIVYCKEYLQLEPRDTDYLFILSACFKLNNQIQDAIDLGEALRLREPHNVKNLINLADSYRIDKNYSRAEKILSYALAIEENNEKALRLKYLLLKEYES